MARSQSTARPTPTLTSSSFKPYVYPTALLNGFTPNSKIVDGPVCIGNWCPQRLAISRLGDANAGNHPLDQRGTRQTVDRAGRQGNRPGQPVPRSSRSRDASVSRRRCRMRRRCRSARTKSPFSNVRSPGRPSPARASRSPRMPCGSAAPAPAISFGVSTATAKKPLQAIPASVAADMASMMSHVVSESTARRAARQHSDRRQDRHHQRLSRRLVRRLHRQLHLHRSGTAMTTIRARNRMTGGSLPAQTWHDIMVAAHPEVEVRRSRDRHGPETAATDTTHTTVAVNSMPKILETKPGPPPVLTKARSAVLVRVKSCPASAARPRARPHRMTQRNRTSRRPAPFCVPGKLCRRGRAGRRRRPRRPRA